MTLAFIADRSARSPSRKLEAQLGASALVPNGGFEHWTTTSFPPGAFGAPATEYPVATDWVARREHAADTLAVARDTSVIDPEGGGASARLIKTGAGGLASLRHTLPAQAVAEWQGRTVTIRARIRQGVAGNARLSIHDGALASSPTRTETGSFETYSVTKTISPTATAIWIGVETGVASLAADTVHVDNVAANYGLEASRYAPPPVVQPSQLAPLATVAQLAPANPIINGGFDVWQRGTTFTNIASTLYSADRWQISYSTVANPFTITASTDVPAVAALVPAPYSSALLTVNNADPSIGASDHALFSQNIEGWNFLPFWQKPFTVGFWVKVTGTNVIGTYSLGVNNSNGDRACLGTYTINAADTWEYKTVTFPASPSTGTWALTNGLGLGLNFGLMGAAHSTLSTATTGTWQTSNKIISTSQVNLLNTAGNTFRLWGVTLGLGPTVAPYWPRPYDDELARCQRYYQVINNASRAIAVNVDAFTNAYISYVVELPVVMRAAPSVSGEVLTIYPSRNPPGTETGWALTANGCTPRSYEATYQKGGAGATNRWVGAAANLSAEL